MIAVSLLKTDNYVASDALRKFGQREKTDQGSSMGVESSALYLK